MNDQSKALPEYVSPYIKDLIQKTGGIAGPIGKQFLLDQNLTHKEDKYTEYDPQEEESYEVAPGMIYKYRGAFATDGSIDYYGRVLWTISRYCATYCRFCFRGRFVGLPAVAKGVKNDTMSQKPYLSAEDIAAGIEFICTHKEINEVILSGGDPWVVPEKYLRMIVEQLVNLQHTNSVDIIRFHTRAPITNPHHIKDWHYDLLRSIRLPYVVLHINHPSEITDEVQAVISQLRDAGAILLSQSVMLKGVNDDVKTLQELFNSLVLYGVRPYYLHHNDPVSWAEHFTVPFDDAVKIWHQLRPRLSGLAASAKFVIDTPHGVGKVSIPEGGWTTDFERFTDFVGNSKMTTHC